MGNPFPAITWAKVGAIRETRKYLLRIIYVERFGGLACVSSPRPEIGVLQPRAGMAPVGVAERWQRLRGTGVILRGCSLATARMGVHALDLWSVPTRYLHTSPSRGRQTPRHDGGTAGAPGVAALGCGANSSCGARSRAVAHFCERMRDLRDHRIMTCQT